MGRAYSRARQHRDRQLGRHTHVNGYGVTLPNSQRFQNVGEFGDLGEQLLISEGPDFAGLAFPDDSCFVSTPGRYVAIETVEGNIDLPAHEPFSPRRVPFENLVPFAKPVKLTGDTTPKLVGIGLGFVVQPFVLFNALDVCRLAEFCRGLKDPGFIKD
jgi:hypothetical protein